MLKVSKLRTKVHSHYLYLFCTIYSQVSLLDKYTLHLDAVALDLIALLDVFKTQAETTLIATANIRHFLLKASQTLGTQHLALLGDEFSITQNAIVTSQGRPITRRCGFVQKELAFRHL